MPTRANSMKAVRWRSYAAASLLGMAGATLLAAATGWWVLTAAPIGFLFGFFLQKGDLCGASAFSEAFMMRDARKLEGLWVLIVTAMLGFALLDLLGWVKLNPKPFLYLSYLAGGLVFGTGMVLAGGCISGSLYKGAAGNLNSLVALVGVFVGVMSVEFGPLGGAHAWMKSHVLSLDGGRVVSLPAWTGLPFWALALLFAAATASAALLRRKRTAAPAQTGAPEERPPRVERVLTRPWRPWAAGIAIGVLMVPAYLSSAASGRNYPLGVTHGVMQSGLLLVDRGFQHVVTSQPRPAAETAAPAVPSPDPGPRQKRIVWWLVVLVWSLMVGSWVSARMSGRARLLPKPPDEVLVALLGGWLVGVGAAFAGGCVVGNIMSGWALMSVGLFLFGVVTMLANWGVTFLYLMGGQRRR